MFAGVERESKYDNLTSFKFTPAVLILPLLLVVIVPLTSVIVKSAKYWSPPNNAQSVPVYSIVIPNDSNTALPLFPLSIILPSNSTTSFVPSATPTLKVSLLFPTTV